MMNVVLHFMLPTQAAGAIVLDGTPLIVIGSLIICYYLYKNLQHHMNPQAAVLSNNESNILADKEVAGNERNKVRISFDHKVNEENKAGNPISNDDVTDEEIVNVRKEIVFNHR